MTWLNLADLWSSAYIMSDWLSAVVIANSISRSPEEDHERAPLSPLSSLTLLSPIQRPILLDFLRAKNLGIKRHIKDAA
ncbi:hypothetical protein GYMLUDRAFT_75029 [Collybiopsis luxurians FD-317 M1]|uniref:Uncharacterized protein n=1 Tax=Collybiopsis luxurians FD-317 M1 TaxID=944289 RepID=A0A0D0C6X2_9AGAR|nr:hypothetical protein GYMLUDRAFT_75029 [Collybiopsis luxurians FD-317 M1]